MVHQVLHNPELAKLDLGSLISATTGAAHLPLELRTAFERKAKNVSFMQEGPCLLFHCCLFSQNLTGYGMSEIVCPFLGRSSRYS